MREPCRVPGACLVVNWSPAVSRGAVGREHLWALDGESPLVLGGALMLREPLFLRGVLDGASYVCTYLLRLGT